MRLAVALLLGLAISVAGVLFGAWWAPFTIGVLVGVLGRPARLAVPVGGAIGLLAWALPLGLMHVRYGLGPAADSFASIMGFAHESAIPVVLTLLVGLLLGLSGAWLGSAVKRIAAPAGR